MISRIPNQVLNLAAKSFNFAKTPILFARSHHHSLAELFQYQNQLLKIVKITMPRQSEQTLQRIRFVDHLANCGMEVPVFIPSLSGKQIELFKLDSDSYMAFSWQKIEGEVLADLAPRDLNTFYRQWAELLANTHKCSRSFGLDAFPSWQEEWQSCHDALPDEELKAVFFQVKADLEMRSRSSLNFACIHNDAHPLNIVQSSRGLALIDFDRSCRHYFAQDIANAIYSEYSRASFHSRHKIDAGYLRSLFVEPFLESYSSQSTLSQKDLQDIELFLCYRQFVMYAIFFPEIQREAPQYLDVFRNKLCSRAAFLPYSLV